MKKRVWSSKVALAPLISLFILINTGRGFGHDLKQNPAPVDEGNHPTERMLRQNDHKGSESPPTTADQPDTLRQEIDELSSRLDTIETKSILDKIKLSGEFRTRLETIRYKDHRFSDKPADGSSEEIWSNRLRINLRSDIRENIIFHGRLSYYKLWGEFTFDEEPSDWSYPSVPDKEGSLHVERAYIDYFIEGTPLSITFGRLPASDGPPNELKDNTTRKSTWPVMLNDVEADGIIASLALDHLIGLKKSMFRLVYTKFQQHYLRYKGELLDFDDVRGMGAAFETEAPGIRNSLFWLSYVRMDLAPLRDMPGIVRYPESTGYADMATVHLQFDDMAGSGLDWFGAYTHIDIALSPSGTLFQNGYEVSIYSDNISGTIGDRLQSDGVYTGLRYQLPLSFLNFPRVGLEYNYGSKYWLGLLSSGSGSLLNKLATRGNAYELYYIQPLHRNTMFLRAGIILMDHDYFSPLFGNPVESDMKTYNYYLLVDIRF